MFTKAEIKRNLLGSLEIALFMPVARKRFGNSYEDAFKSFLIPILIFPFALMAIYMFPKPEIANSSANAIALAYSLRTVLAWGIFFGIVYWLTKEIDRKEHFYQFVTATNWLAIPASVIFLPVVWMLLSGTHTWPELYPFMMCLTMYSYAFTAFMASKVLRIPMELAMFIAFIAINVDNGTMDLFYWVGDRLNI